MILLKKNSEEVCKYSEIENTMEPPQLFCVYKNKFTKSFVYVFVCVCVCVIKKIEKI